ncbi:MAG: electron transfer flavoprotein subunit alpha/FixB family protein [Anaerolineaceae bacterium]|nr:electron transfer flavoprotein subunit alpha/FixB family protein [Anaerolineaceae bacterium]
MANHMDVWVFSEKPVLLFELIGGAQPIAGQFGGHVVALVIGALSEAEQAIAYGAESVFWLGERKPGSLVDDYVPTISHLMNENKPAALLVGSTKLGRAVAGRLAAHLNTTVLTEIKELQYENGSLQVLHMIFGGGAIRIDRSLSEVFLATAGLGVFTACPPQAERSGKISEVNYIEPAWHFTLRERKSKPKVTVNLNEAKKVVCAGRGIARKEDLSMISDLAQLLGAEVGCSRPLAEGLDWLPRERYIGVSGAMIKPDLYLGVGVSGQVQHTVGMSNSRVVVTINKDNQAPIFAHTDYGIVGDLYVVVPALIDALKSRRSG